MKINKRLVALAGAAVLAGTLMTGCSSPADIAASNLSKAAEQFEIPRRIVGINGITDKFLFEVTGYCSVETSDSALGGALEYTCKTGAGYKKGFLGLGDNVTFVVEQLEPAMVSEDQYRVIIRPDQIVPAFELDSSVVN